MEDKELVLEDEIKCPYCGQEIENTLNDIFNKEVVFENDETDYECPQCGKMFNILIDNLALGSLLDEDGDEDYGREIEGFTISIQYEDQTPSLLGGEE